MGALRTLGTVRRTVPSREQRERLKARRTPSAMTAPTTSTSSLMS